MTDAPKDQSATRVLVMAACFTIVVAGMKAAASILVPFLLAVFIAVISAPLFLALRRKNVPAGIALLLMVLILAVVGLIGVGVVRASLNGFIRNLPKYQNRLRGQTEQVEQWLEKRMGPLDQTATEVWNPQVAMRYLGTAASALKGVLTQTFLILLVVVFILLEAAILPAKVRALPQMTDATWDRLQTVVDEVRRYMSMKTAMSLLTGVLVTLLTAAVGVDYPVLLGLLAFVLNYVPNIGSIVAAVPGILLAFVESGLGIAAITAVGYVAVNVGISNFIEPRYMGRGLGLSPLVILLSMIFWGWVLGPVGMLLSVPLTMTAKIALENSEETRWIAMLMGTGKPKR